MIKMIKILIKQKKLNKITYYKIYNKDNFKINHKKMKKFNNQIMKINNYKMMIYNKKTNCKIILLMIIKI